MIDATYARQVLNLETKLNNLVLGQPQATRKICEVLLSSAAGLKGDVPKPLGVFFLTGPTGVGKTETGMALAKPGVFYPPDVRPNLVILNMADYQSWHQVARLTGSPPGYVDSDKPCAFHPVKANPHTVFIIDEIEKAHPEVPAVFLAIFDKGKHRSGMGEEYTFEKSIFVITSNAPDPVACFTPEFRNRLDAIIRYEELKPESYEVLIRRKVEAMSGILQNKFGVRLQISCSELSRLARQFHEQMQHSEIEENEEPRIGFGRPLGRSTAKLANPFAGDGLITPGTGARELSRIMEKAASTVTTYLLQEIVTASDQGRPNRTQGSIIRLKRIVGKFEARVIKNGVQIAVIGEDGQSRPEPPGIVPAFGPGSYRPLPIKGATVRMLSGPDPERFVRSDSVGDVEALRDLTPLPWAKAPTRGCRPN